MPHVKLRAPSVINAHPTRTFRALPATLLVIAALAAAGCSKSLRLGMPSADSGPSTASRSSLGKKPAERAPQTITRSQLPPTQDYQWNGAPHRVSEGGPPGLKPGSRPLDVPPRVIAAAPPTANYAQPPPQPLAPGVIEVQPGDSLYSLSRRHGVSISALMEENNLHSISLQPGQQLRLPRRSQRRG